MTGGWQWPLASRYMVSRLYYGRKSRLQFELNSLNMITHIHSRLSMMEKNVIAT